MAMGPDLASLTAVRSAALAAQLNARRKRVGLMELSAQTVEKYVMAARLDLTRAEALYNMFLSQCAFLKRMPPRSFVDALQDGIFMLPTGVQHVFDGSLVAVLVLRNYLHGETDLERLKQSIVFQIMQVVDDENVKKNGMSLVIDCSEALYSRNWNGWLGRWLLNALEHMLPVQLKHVYFVRAPMWVNMSVLGIRMFMAATVSSRVVMLDDLDQVLEKKFHSLAFRPDDFVYALLNKPPMTYPEFVRADEVPKQIKRAVVQTGTSKLPPASEIVPEQKEMPKIPEPISDEEGAVPPKAVQQKKQPATSRPVGDDQEDDDGPQAMPTKAEPIAVAAPPRMRASSANMPEDESPTSTVFEGEMGGDIDSDIDSSDDEALDYANYDMTEDVVESMLRFIASKSSHDIKHEYDEIQQANTSTYEAQSVENEHKNRYPNIMAYDRSRVKLVDYKQLTDAAPTDYINANFVAGFDRPNKYIATQGPLYHTAHAFWLMVFEQKANTIVMVTREKEHRRVKCERYWPEKDETNEYGGGSIVVTNIMEEFAEEFIVRQFIIKSAEESVHVNHFQYTGWPDFGVPEGEDGTGAMLHFWIELVLKSQQKCRVATAPIVTHCSAGIGRTGTLILLDRALEELHKGGRIALSRSLATMRRDRYGLVMTAEQYQFVYMMLEDYLSVIRDHHSP